MKARSSVVPKEEMEIVINQLSKNIPTKAIRDNDDEDIVDVGSSAPGNNDVDDDNDTDSDRNNNNHEEQEESDATQQYPKRTREQVINDRYILKQHMPI